MCWIYSLSLSHMSMREKVNKPSAGDTLSQVPYHIVVTLSPNQRMPKEQKTHERSFLMDYLASSSNVLPLLTLDLRDIINLFKNQVNVIFQLSFFFFSLFGFFYLLLLLLLMKFEIIWPYAPNSKEDAIYAKKKEVQKWVSQNGYEAKMTKNTRI